MPDSYIRSTTYAGRPGVAVSNGHVELIVLTGGGHIASVRRPNDTVNPLWCPQWETIEPAHRRMADPDVFGDGVESQLLSCIMGHNLCLDVFGAHSEGEAAVGNTFHGEAGFVAWEVTGHSNDAAGVTLKMSAHLRHTALDVEREFTLPAGQSVVRVREEMRNLAGFERALGKSQHATIGTEFLSPGPALFSCNADRGMTWPDHDQIDVSTLAPMTGFNYPHLPGKNGEKLDWREFPRGDCSSDLMTLRIRPAETYGWVVAAQPKLQQTFAYVWEREAYPWLMTWEENRGRDMKPWNCQEITRGLEFSSYSFATSRRDNVERESLFGEPCYEWLDAYATKVNTFHMVAADCPADLAAAPELNISGDRVTATSGALQFDLK